MHPLNFLDVNCSIGPWHNMPPAANTSAQGLLAKMDDLGVAEACPFHAVARDHSLAEGNRALLDETKGNDRLHPVWTVSPHHTGECPSPSDLLGQLAESGARLARVSFGTSQYVPHLDLFLFGSLFDALAEAQIPLTLGYDDIAAASWPEIHDALSRWPGLRIILSIPKVTFHDRYFYALWDKFDTFYVELSGYQVLGGIEAVTERFGPGRLVFGSRYPHFSPLQSMLQIIYAEVDEEVKRGIAGETVRGMMRNA